MDEFEVDEDLEEAKKVLLAGVDPEQEASVFADNRRRLTSLLEDLEVIMKRLRDMGDAVDIKDVIASGDMYRKACGALTQLETTSRRLQIWEKKISETTDGAKESTLGEIQELLLIHKRRSDILTKVLDGNISLEAAKKELSA